MARWYYVENQVTKGPVEPAELYRLATTGVVGPTTPVATEGATSWTTFAEVVHSIAPPPAGPTGFEAPQPVAAQPEPAAPMAVRATGSVTSRLAEPDERTPEVTVELRLEVIPEPDGPWKTLWSQLADDDVVRSRTHAGDDHIAVRLAADTSPSDDVQRALAHIDRVNEAYGALSQRGRDAAAEVAQILAARPAT